ncbi:MAG: TIGR00159 family protein [Chloroflexi bacterium]|nr:TIGR00159 family protein [Chloroflexota bacterium]
MPDFLWFLSRLDLLSVLDIALVTVLFYGVLVSIQGTRAVQLIWGVVLLVLAILISNLLQLTALSWLFKSMVPALFLAIVVIFQPEVRRVLERLGRTGELFNRPWSALPAQRVNRMVDAIVQACGLLAERRRGALIVLERNTGLQDYVDTGVEIDGLVTAQALLTIFTPETPLHDGAAIIRGDRIAAAGCVLPLSENSLPDPLLGTRHRAAIGITEEGDAVSVVVSEETGIISLVKERRMVRNMDAGKLKKALLSLYKSAAEPNLSSWLKKPVSAEQKDSRC